MLIALIFTSYFLLGFIANVTFLKCDTTGGIIATILFWPAIVLFFLATLTETGIDSIIHRIKRKTNA
jgi:hypothetical protein